MAEETESGLENIVPANDHHRRGPEATECADADIAPWQKLDKVVLSMPA
ncbi:hypothetical protein [Pelagibacterium sp. H642]|nr:hypothetical protein [Pelagibacterium sp. H642]WMT92592.1 hypothetical protein NO934_19800 [Pelagibacterium sp. H642]